MSARRPTAGQGIRYAAAGCGRPMQEIRGSFDEYNLDYELRHGGSVLRLADLITFVERSGHAYFRMHVDH